MIRKLLDRLFGRRCCGNCRWFIGHMCRRMYRPRCMYECGHCRNHEWERLL